MACACSSHSLKKVQGEAADGLRLAYFDMDQAYAMA